MNVIRAFAGLILTIALESAVAQVPEPPAAEPVPPTPREAAPLDEAKLDQYADAHLAIEEIQATASEELAKAEGPAAEHQIKSNAERAMIEAVERAGLKLQEFNQITEVMALDPALRAQIRARIDERRRI